MLAIYFILPAIALCLTIWMFSRPLPLLFGMCQLEQSAIAVPELVEKLSTEREHRDEYETLIELGFRPLGTYTESIGFINSPYECLVLHHDSLPVFAALSKRVDQHLYVRMLTAGDGGRMLHTTSLSDGFEHSDEILVYQKVEVPHTEDVFAAHIETLSQWEQNGFRAQLGSQLDSFATTSKMTTEHPALKKLFRKTCTSTLSGYFVVGVVFPLVFGSIFTAMSDSFGFANFTPLLWLQFVSGWSLVYSFIWFKITIQFVKNSKTNSLTKGAETRVLETVEIETSTTNSTKTFQLAPRETEVLQGNAAMVLFGTCSGILMCGVMVFISIRLLVNGQFGLFALPPTLVPLYMLSQLVPAAVYMYQILRGQSEHRVTVGEGKVTGIEKHLLKNHVVEMDIEDVTTMHVESLTSQHFSQSPVYMKLGYQTLEDQWGALILKGEQHKNCIHLAAGYRVDTLSSLAYELAEEIGLPTEAVVLLGETRKSQDTKKPASSKKELVAN